MNASSSSSSILGLGYTPSVYVQYGVAMNRQSFLLLGLAGVRTERDSRFQLSAKYYLTLVGLPALLFLLGILSMSFMNMGLLARLCFRWLACYPQKSTSAQKTRRQRGLTLGVAFASLLNLLSVALLYLANDHLDSGIVRLTASMRSLSALLDPLRGDLEAITGLATSLVASVASVANVTPQCSVALQTSALVLQSSASAVQSVVGEVSAQTKILEGYLTTYLAPNARKYATYALAAIPLVLVLLHLALIHQKSASLLKILIGCSVGFYYLQVLAGLPTTLLSSLLADVCESPFSKILGAAGSPRSDVYNLTRYYSTCEGGNLAQVLLAEAGQSSLALASNSRRNQDAHRGPPPLLYRPSMPRPMLPRSTSPTRWATCPVALPFARSTWTSSTRASAKASFQACLSSRLLFSSAPLPCG